MAEKQDNQQKKIIIDEDWKQQARKEKEVLSAQEQSEKEKPPQDKRPRGSLPPGNFAALVSMLVTQALFALGVLEVEGRQREPDLDMAKYNIDMLETLQAKTKGNLTDQEQKVLEDTLSQVRMAYVKVAG
ncbi:MAG TPA: DUF1844 domain-containing protein [Sedimentisphaerales bacterium]|nr:DUF1844 domain-containing protein [Sedimentisphaerales bacterium]